MLGVLLIIFLASHAWSQSVSQDVDRNFIRQSLESIAHHIDQEYFDEMIAGQVASRLRMQMTEGRYDKIASIQELSEFVTRDLYAWTQDKHLAVSVIAANTTNSSSSRPSESREVMARRSNFGIQRVEILGGNVGYFQLTSFYRPEEAGEAIASAMKLLQHADALIFDLRDNGGGSPDTVVLVASYLLGKPNLSLFTIHPRSGPSNRVYQTAEVDAWDREGNRPIFVLTSQRTFSGGEGMAFLLQEHQKAVVIGEQTAGAANPGRPYPINDRLEVTVPNGQIRSSVSGGNWEGKGVVPNIAMASEDAFQVAYRHALRHLIQKTSDEAWQAKLKEHLQQLDAK